MTWKGYWQKGHPFQPFVLPIDAPSSDPLDGASHCLHFNEEWMPYVLGALKVLTRPETWQGATPADVELATQRAHTLFNQEDDCGECPGFYVSTCHDYIEFSETYVAEETIEDCACVGHGQVYEFIVSTNPLTASARLGLCCFEWPSGDKAGGHIERLEILSEDPLAATPLYTLNGEDCLDLPLDTLIFTGGYVRSSFTMKHIEIVAGYAFRVQLRISGPVLCTVA